jgi:hypothetical protein
MSERHALLAAAPLVCALLAVSCTTPADPNGRAQPTAPPPPIVASPEASSTARSGGASSATPSAATNPLAVASPSPSIAVALDVSPAQVAVGDVVLSLALEPARHMVDQNALVSADPAQQAALDGTAGGAASGAASGAAGGTSLGAVVLGDMVRVTNNLDPTQALPPDLPQSIIRHAMVDVRSRDGSSEVPYLGVSMDVLLDGHPVSFGQAVVPMVTTGPDPARLYYGNNVRLSQRGTYQVFVRLNRNPLLGKDQPQAAQFNVVVR